MYCPGLASLFTISIGLIALLVSSSPTPANPLQKQNAPKGAGNEFLGSLTWYPQQPEYMLATISNNSTTRYAVLSKNNLFDDEHPFNPISVATLSGTPVTLRGTRYPYPSIEDNQFKNFPPGTVWQRYFNMSEYMPPSSSIDAATSECFAFQLPTVVEALNLDNITPGQHLADIFLSQGLTNVAVSSLPIHMNVTLMAGTGTETTGASAASQTIPSEPSGIYLAPSEQSGSVIDLAENTDGSLSTGFEIGSGSSGSVTSA
ncbi:MAG: hypothetical protein Q9222_007724 [Ikaeria aurantiellina]